MYTMYCKEGRLTLHGRNRPETFPSRNSTTKILSRKVYRSFYANCNGFFRLESTSVLDHPRWPTGTLTRVADNFFSRYLSSRRYLNFTEMAIFTVSWGLFSSKFQLYIVIWPSFLFYESFGLLWLSLMVVLFSMWVKRFKDFEKTLCEKNGSPWKASHQFNFSLSDYRLVSISVMNEMRKSQTEI